MGNPTAGEASELFEMLGENSQQKSVRNTRRGGTQTANEVSSLREDLTQFMKEVRGILKPEAIIELRQVQRHLCGEHGRNAATCQSKVEEWNYE